MNLLGAILYDPGTAASKATTGAAVMAVCDATNLALAITVPAHGKVLVKMRTVLDGATTMPQVLLGVMNHTGGAVLGRVTPMAALGGTALATTHVPLVAEFLMTGLSPGALTLDAAFGVEVGVASTAIRWGGPNNTVASDAWGAFQFEAWDPQPLPTAVPGAANGLQIAGSNAATTYAALTVTAATTLTGNVALANGLTITQATTNGAGIAVTGNGTGDAITLTGGATSGDGLATTGGGSGRGIHAAGGATGQGVAITTTAADGFTIIPTGGSAIVATGNGTNKHGIIATGGTAGVSDGMTLVAGTGGVDFRANQTGNLTGNISGSAGSVTGAVGSVTGAVGSVTGAVGSVTGAVGSVTGAVGSVTGAVGSVTAGVTLANGAHGGAAATLTLGGAGGLTATHTGNTTGSVASVAGAVASVTGNVGGNVVGSVASVTADVGITQAGADKVWGSAARTLTSFGTLVADMATAVWGATTRILTAGTNIVLAKGTGVTGFNDIAATAIVSAGAITTSAGKVSGVILTDTVTTYTGNTPQTGDTFARVGAAGAGLTALGDARVANLDATISSRSTQSSVDAIPTAPLLAVSYTAPDNAGIAAIAGKAASLTFTRAGELDVNVQSINDKPLSGTGAAGDLFVV